VRWRLARVALRLRLYRVAGWLLIARRPLTAAQEEYGRRLWREIQGQ